jgi:AcrR family transcriptional regulator
MKGTGRRTPRQAAKREQIVSAASRVFASRPYHLVCMDDVAEAARVGKGTLYRYFPSKEDLYLGVVAEAFDLLIRRLDRVEAENLPAPRALARMIEAIVETFAAHLPFFRLMQQGEARLFLRKKQVVRARREHIAEGLARVLERGAQIGVFRKVDRVMVPTMVIGLVWATALNHADETPAEILGQRVVDLCFHGILQPQPESP